MRTGQPSKKWEQPKFTAKHFTACENTSKLKSKFNTRIKGLNAETVAIRYLEGLGARLICRNLPTIYSEIDLIFLTANNEIWLIEVKLVYHDELIFDPPVKQQQRKRLRRLLDRWIESVDKPVRFHLAAVNHDHEVLLFEDFLS